MKFEEEFLSGIGTAFDLGEGHCAHDRGLGERFAQRFGEVCHGLEGDRAFFEDPFDELFCAEAGLAEAGDELCHFLWRESEEAREWEERGSVGHGACSS